MLLYFSKEMKTGIWITVDLEDERKDIDFSRRQESKNSLIGSNRNDSSTR